MKKIGYALLMGAIVVGSSVSASAEELWTPHPSGVQAGLATGHLPPEGVYFINSDDYVSSNLYGPEGKTSGTKVTGIIEIPEIAWITPWKVFGADWGVAIAQPWDRVDFNAPVGNSQVYGDVPSLSKSGLYATYLTPGYLSWHLPNNLYFATRGDIYVPDGGYKDPLKNGNSISGNLNALGFYSFQPSIALSWLQDGWNLSAKILADLNLKNQTNNYRSGDSISSELTATKTIGKWTAGITGYTKDQIQNDSGSEYSTYVAYGLAQDKGNRDRDNAVGPYVAYNFGPIAISLWYDHSFDTVNTIGGDQFWTRFLIPLY